MAGEKTVRLSLSELSTHQLALYTAQVVTEMRNLMSDLAGAVSDLQSAVDGVAQRLLPKIADLEAALAAAQADDADVTNAVTAIRAEVDALNALGQDPSTPVDTTMPPVDPPEVQVPADPNAPVVDNTLPGDLPQDAPVEEAPPEATQLPAE